MPTTPSALEVDLYELRMAASYLRRGMTQPATFSLFVRRLPPERGFLVAAGLADAVAALTAFAFHPDELAWLGTQGFAAEDLRRFEALRFDGRVRAVPEGRIVLAEEPLVEVTASLPVAQLVETLLLNQITYQTAIATKAARCRLAAGDRIELVDFSMRRTHGLEAAAAVARLSSMVGFTGTSNVAAARRFGLRPVGTMAHAYIQAFPTEAAAFDAFAADNGTGTTLLVDTYDTLDGVRHAITTIERHGAELPWGVRLDSGDLVALAVQTRRLLDDAGLHHVRIFASGGLDEYDLERFVQRAVPIDAAGIGTRLGVSADAPSLDSAYKLVDVGDRPVMKLSTGKATRPGAKQVLRAPGTIDDVLTTASAPVPPDRAPLLETVVERGRSLIDWPPPLAASRAHFELDLAALPPDAARVRAPVPPALRVSDELETLTRATATRLGAHR